jgi:hypothetical protein
MPKTIKALKDAIAAGRRDDIAAAHKAAWAASSPEEITNWLSNEELDALEVALA